VANGSREIAARNARERAERSLAAADAILDDHGTVWLLTPQTDPAREWLDEHVSDAQWFGPAIGVAHRMVENLADGMREAGLVIVVRK
jgi:hypothetical protein